MFPTHVGMNRNRIKPVVIRVDVPHTRGDEPSRQVPLEFLF